VVRKKAKLLTTIVYHLSLSKEVFLMISAQAVKELRERTGAGMMDCKKALMEANGDMEKAIDILREKGLAAAAKKAGRVANEGLVDAYIHSGGRIGVLVEVNCDISREDVPQAVLEKEREILKAQALNEGKPQNVVDRIVEGRIEKFYKENCLLEQEYIRDPEKTVKDLLNETIAKLGENIVIRRFVRFERGEGIETSSNE
jgi:elongation factor Ts